MDQKSERFLAAYNRIEKQMEQILFVSTREVSHRRSFPELIRRCSQVSAAVRQHEADLRELGELRNAIVHGSVDPEEVIAEPHEKVVRLIESISDSISAPEKVIPRFAKRVIYVIDESPFHEALDLIAAKGFTQLPVFTGSGQFRGLLTETGISKWLALNHSRVGSISGHVNVSDVLACEDPSYNCSFIKPDTDVFEVREIFARNQRRDKQKIKALLITTSGLPQLPLLGIITPWDLASLYSG